eukprot:m.147383 g.147383  ORF g.147383 m.147383 type:complete len:695 (-) comp14986_c1_seq4:194-2278(-)
MSSLIAIKANYQGEDIRRFSIAHDATFADVQKSLLQTFGKLGNISWQDEEGDIITIRTEQDWKEAIKGRPTLLRLTLNGTAEFIQEKETKPEEDQRTQPQSSPTQPQPSPGSNFTLPGFEEYLASMMSSQRFPTDQARQETRPGSTPTPVPNPPIVFGMGASGLSGMDDLTKRISEVAVEAASRVVESLGSSGVIPDMAHRVQSQREQSTEIQRDEEREEATPPTSEAGAQKLTDKDVKVIKELRAQMFDKRKYEKDDIVMDILSQGELRRTRLDGTGSRKVIAQFGTKSTQRTVRGLHFLKKVKPYGRVRSVSNECVTYSLANEKSVEALNDPTVAQDVIYGLQKGMRDISKIPQQTPFLQQKQTMKQSPRVGILTRNAQYHITDSDGRTITVIDCPGLAEDLKEQQNLIKTIHNSFKNSFNEPIFCIDGKMSAKDRKEFLKWVSEESKKNLNVHLMVSKTQPNEMEDTRETLHHAAMELMLKWDLETPFSEEVYNAYFAEGRHQVALKTHSRMHLRVPYREEYTSGSVKTSINLHSPKSKSFLPFQDDLLMYTPFMDTGLLPSKIQEILADIINNFDDITFQSVFEYVKGKRVAKVSREDFKIVVSDDHPFYKFTLFMRYTEVLIDNKFVYAKLGDPDVMSVIEQVSDPLLVQKKFFTVLQSILTGKMEMLPGPSAVTHKMNRFQTQINHLG